MHYLWSVLHQKNVLTLPLGFKVRTTYPILLIVGLICLAYFAGRFYLSEKRTHNIERQTLYLGLACLLGFGILRGCNLYGDPGQFVIQETTMLTLMSFFNPTKYPLSLQFMLLTIGIGLIALFLLKRLKPTFSINFLQILGKTSLFSYIIHLYLLHIISWLLILVLGLTFNDMTYGETLISLPEGFGLSY